MSQKSETSIMLPCGHFTKVRKIKARRECRNAAYDKHIEQMVCPQCGRQGA